MYTEEYKMRWYNIYKDLGVPLKKKTNSKSLGWICNLLMLVIDYSVFR